MRRFHRRSLHVEWLESRCLLSGTPLLPGPQQVGTPPPAQMGQENCDPGQGGQGHQRDHGGRNRGLNAPPPPAAIAGGQEQRVDAGRPASRERAAPPVDLRGSFAALEAVRDAESAARVEATEAASRKAQEFAVDETETSAESTGISEVASKSNDPAALLRLDRIDQNRFKAKAMATTGNPPPSLIRGGDSMPRSDTSAGTPASFQSLEKSSNTRSWRQSAPVLAQVFPIDAAALESAITTFFEELEDLGRQLVEQPSRTLLTSTTLAVLAAAAVEYARRQSRKANESLVAVHEGGIPFSHLR